MQGIWVSLKQTVHCSKGKAATDVMHQKHPHTPIHYFSKSKSKSNTSQLLHHNYSYTELKIGDSPRNVIERIIISTSTNCHSRRNISKVLKVNISADMLASFEKYREEVKGKTTFLQGGGYNSSSTTNTTRHPRIMVDGNELLLFYGTTTNCSVFNSISLSKLFCIDPHCQVCRTIQSGFSTNSEGIRLNTRSSWESPTNEDKRNVYHKAGNNHNTKRAVIVCRTIAGQVGTVVDGGDFNQDYDSVLIRRGSAPKSESLIVKNPNAIIPCFVVVFN